MVYRVAMRSSAWVLGLLLASVAGRFSIPGASEASLSKAFRKTKELPTTETAFPLDQMLSRFLKMCQAFEPFTLRLDDPDKAKHLLEDFESGKLVVSVIRQDKENNDGTA